MVSTPAVWFAKLSTEMQRRLVLDPAQRLSGDLKEAIHTARGVPPLGDRLRADEVAWLEMTGFAERHDQLDQRLVRESERGGMKDSDPDAYAELERQVHASASEMSRLFEGQSAAIWERLMRERPQRAAGLNPAELRGDDDEPVPLA